MFNYFKLLSFYKEILCRPYLFKKIIPMLWFGISLYPVAINMVISNRCNFACKMCHWKNHERRGKIADNTILSSMDVHRFIEAVKKYKPLIHFSGGEPFMRKDMVRIISEVKQQDLKCIVNTNGYFLKKDICDALFASKLDMLIISLYGLYDVYDKIVGVKGAYTTTLKNIQYLLENRSAVPRIIVSATITEDNIDYIESFITAMQKLKIDKVKIEHLNFLTKNELERSYSDGRNYNLTPYTFVRDELFTHSFYMKVRGMMCRIKNRFSDFVLLKPSLIQNEIAAWYTKSLPNLQMCTFINY